MKSKSKSKSKSANLMFVIDAKCPHCGSSNITAYGNDARYMPFRDAVVPVELFKCQDCQSDIVIPA